MGIWNDGKDLWDSENIVRTLAKFYYSENEIWLNKIEFISVDSRFFSLMHICNMHKYYGNNGMGPNEKLKRFTTE